MRFEQHLVAIGPIVYTIIVSCAFSQSGPAIPARLIKFGIRYKL